MEGNLFNSGFLGSKFLWWIGQVADDRTWRENQNPKKVGVDGEDPKEETPAWGYRYKVRIMGLHDKEESSLSSDMLPWAQVMYSVWGGGLAGSRQTPGIRQGMFVFGFFLDGADQQVPVIMGILGANGKTVVKNLKTGKDEDGDSFGPQSGWANAHTDECKIVPDEQIATAVPSSVGTTESTDTIHQETVQDRKMKDVLERKHALACPDPLHQSDTKNLQTMVAELAKKIQQRQRAEEDYANAVSVGLPTNPMSNDIQKMIDDSAGEMSGPMKGIMNQAQQKTIDEHNLKMLVIFILAIPAFKNLLLTTNIAALETIACKFNEISKGLAGLIAAALAASFARKSKQPQSTAVQSANASQGKGTSGPGGGDSGSGDGGDGGYQPTLPEDVSQGIELPSPAPKGYYQPSPICSTEELLGEILGSTINDITSAFGAANNSIVTAANDGNNPDIDSEAGSEPTKSVDMSLSERNVSASLEKGALVGGIAAAFATAAGVDKNVIGRVTRAFEQGQYGYGLEVMANLADVVGTDAGRKQLLGNIMDQIDSGDIAGGFSESANLFGVPVSLLAGVGAGFAAIKSNDMGALTSAVQSMGSIDPAIMGAVAGMADSGSLISGVGGQSGLEVDIAESMNFVQSITKIFDCDPDFECSPNDEHTLDEGGEGAKDEPNCAAIAQAAEDAKEKPKPVEYREVPIYNRRGIKTGTRKEIVS